ncbi:EAL domain-containing protein [Dasania marina]|uniref:putative bifunctional diguanylate cyclase/phosphodiesterase n=1 Tax=Dasania marina TaxID=471499 RepID=UPI0030DA539C|tara:strand:+ start:7406 stop:9310 length:1905 start_codon:yes stop_codon:yes gene_type:complete
MSNKADSETNIRILIADDEASIRESYKNILQPDDPEPSNDLQEMRARLFNNNKAAKTKSRFDLTLCSGAEEAVQAVRTSIQTGQPFSLVFLDMRMPPGPDGAWAATRIRELDPSLDIVIVTAYSDIDPEEISAQVPPADSLFYVQKPFHVHEIRQLANALSRRRQAEDRMRQLAYFDDITGLHNRISFKNRLEIALKNAERNQRCLAILYLDLDNFKRVNDTLGHAVGDIMLNEVSKRLLLAIRDTDAITSGHAHENINKPTTSKHSNSLDNKHLARMGGDEFSLLLSEIADGTHAAIVAKRVLEALEQPISLDGHELIVTSSIGIAVYPTDGKDADSLLKCADLAMYASKQESRNTFNFYTASMKSTALRHMELEEGLRSAIERNELSIHYQPQLDVSSAKVSGAEALLRWHSSELGEVSPVEFISVAEDTGLIYSIGEWVLRNACTQVKSWRDAGMRLPQVAVNVSVKQFSHVGFVPLVQQVLQETGLEPAALELEITESVLMKDGDQAFTTLNALKALGVKLAIDDFGTGYSNLAYLKRFPIDKLKIDRAFISAEHVDTEDQAIVTAIIAMAESLNMSVTAEGVETEGQLNMLKTQRCDDVQGFLLSRPLPAQCVSDFLLLNSSAANDGND